ncbi:MAG: hypothetical protein WC899_00975 [bacterium]|jgi:predicted TIM-barrel fold metal-dependent hydrolase
MISLDEVKAYLDFVKEVKKDYNVIDMHVHPYEMMLGGIKYIQNSQYEGLYSTNGSKYECPVLSYINEDREMERKYQTFSSKIIEKTAILSLRRTYHHTGPKVFYDHMCLSGIDKILLLPVFGPDESDATVMEEMKYMFGNDERFLIGYCVPNAINNNDIVNNIKYNIDKYNIIAIKIHPNRTAIDISTENGKDRIEHLLEASRDTNLCVIIHSGVSKNSFNGESNLYSKITDFLDINWNITKEPVVIAHAGVYGHNINDINESIMPNVKKLLNKYDNLLIDIAGLNIESISVIIKNIDVDRILFGSDALYYYQWKAIVSLVHSLKNSNRNYEEDFIRIVSKNPEKYIIKNK